jgi:hypothetical protein
MQYVEILRSRRVLTWYCGLLLGALIIVAFSFYYVHAQMNGRPEFVPLAHLIKGCAFGALILATCVAPGLNAESSTLAITWTRPISRAAIAWRYIAVDIATILVGFAFLIALVLVFFALFGQLGEVTIDASIVPAVLGALGCALMWYGLITVVTARMDGRGGLIAGVSWGVFVVLGLLWIVPFPAPLHGLITVLNYFDPLAYFTSVSSDSHSSRTIIPLDPNVKTAIAWGFAVVTSVATVRLWSTREV